MAFNTSYQKALAKLTKVEGDPNYVAMGTAIGVLVGFTPTIPFHTLLALLFAFALRGSKPAAVIGTWVANPFTIPFFYFASYKTGELLGLSDINPSKVTSLVHSLASPLSFSQKWQIIGEFLKGHLDTALTMLIGSVILGIIPAIISYFLAVRFLRIYNEKREPKHDITY